MQQSANASQAGAPNPKGLAVEASQARQITSGGVKYYSCAWTPNSKLVCSADASGTRDLWIMDADGSHQKQLTSDAGSNFQPAVTPDGRYIVFGSDRNGKQNIWRIDSDGNHPTQLTNSEFNRNPSITPDGKWVVFVSLSSKQTPTIWKVPIEGGAAVQINDKYSVAPVVSPDGKLIACYYWDEMLNSQLGIAVIPFDGGEPVKKFNLPSTFVRWTQDGRGLVYIDNRGGVSNLWMQPLDEGKPVQLTNFQTDQIFAFDWSPDGKQLTLARGTVASDVVLFSDLK
jgi:TolB protein